MNRIWNKFLLEGSENNDIDLPPLDIQDTLNMDVWQTEDRIKPAVSSRLIQIAMDFLGTLDISDRDILDIIFTGSLANYNWTKYSDLDLHIVVDFSKIDDNTKLVKDFFDSKKNDWNKQHQIMIKNHEVELYLQNAEESHVSTGVYSLLEDVWLVKPNREHPKIDRKSIKVKAKSIMDQIDKVEELFEKNNYEAAYNVGNLIRDKIKRLRRCGLMEKGIFSVENLVFKTLRNSEYIGKLLDLRTDAYDKMMSLNHNVV